MDYVLNVFKGEEFLFAIGGKHMNYVNVIWWQLEKLIDIINDSKEVSKNQLLSNIIKYTEYFNLASDGFCSKGLKLDITNKTIEVDHIQLYNFEDVTHYNCGRELVKVDGEYKIEYEACDEEPFDVDYIEFDLDLLSKKILSFDELLKVANFINGLLDEYKRDCIVNNEKFLLLTEI